MTDEDPRNPLGLTWADLVGKRVLVGLTRQDMRGEVVDHEQFHGRIAIADPIRGLTLDLDGAKAGKTYSLPPDLRAFTPADPGDYRLRSTGEVVRDPDFLATWIVQQPDS